MGLELVGRVSRAVLALLVPLIRRGGALAGWPGALGVLAGGLISLASFTWIARGVRSSARLFAGGRAHPLWALGLALALCRCSSGRSPSCSATASFTPWPSSSACRSFPPC